MDKVELARRLAQLSRLSRGKTADEVDALVYDLFKTKNPAQKGDEGPSPKARSSAPGEKR